MALTALADSAFRLCEPSPAAASMASATTPVVTAVAMLVPLRRRYCPPPLPVTCRFG